MLPPTRGPQAPRYERTILENLETLDLGRHLWDFGTLCRCTLSYFPNFIILHRMIILAMGKKATDTAIQAKRTPKSRPMRECVSKRIVREASTTILFTS